jgi:hypothetical protein
MYKVVLGRLKRDIFEFSSSVDLDTIRAKKSGKSYLSAMPLAGYI